MEPVPRDRVAGIVLCGGRSTRMGRPKLALPFGPETMLYRVVRILAETVSPVVVVAARGQELPALPPKTIVAIDRVDDRGPLGGLAAGMSALEGRAEAAYVSACDVPLLKPEFIAAIVEALGPHELAVPSDGQFHHPLAGVYRMALTERVSRLIDEERLGVHLLIQESDAILVDVNELRAVDPALFSLRNANTSEEYRNALRDAGFEPDARSAVKDF